MMVVTVGSLLIALYLTLQIFLPETGHSAEGTPATPHATSTRPSSPTQTIDLANPPDQAPWITNGESVPDWALYPYKDDPDAWAPHPEQPVKEQSWYNRLLFPPKHCAYCGRRVPTKKGSYVFLLIGFVGQIAFSLRFTVQWIASERKKASVVPEAFWWLSIFGSLLLLTYAISILAWPIILGQAPNVLIYGRNLHLIRKAERDALEIEQEPTGGADSDSDI